MNKDNTATTVKADVASIAGSLMSDSVMSALTESNRKLVSQATEIGELEGKLKVSKLKNEQIEKDAKDSAKVITIKVTEGSNRYRDTYSSMYGMLRNNSVEDVFTENVSSLEDIANAVVNKKATQDVEKAETTVKETKEKLSMLSDSMANLRKLTNTKIEAVNKTLEDKVEKAERRNLKEIDSLNSTIKIKNKQILIAVDEHENAMFEKDIAIEELQSINALLEKKIELLGESTSTVTERIVSRFKSHWYGRKFKTLATLDN